MNQNIEDKNEIRNLRIFAVVVFAVMLSAAIIVGKYSKSSDGKNLGRLEFLVK